MTTSHSSRHPYRFGSALLLTLTLTLTFLLSLSSFSFVDASRSKRGLRFRGVSPSSTPSPTSSASPLLWPQPLDATVGTSVLCIDPSSFSFVLDSSASQGRTSNGDGAEILQRAFARYKTLLFPLTPSTRTSKDLLLSSSCVASLHVSVDQFDVDLQLGVDESSTLIVSDAGDATLHAKTVWGALRALETFSQLVVWDDSSRQYSVVGVPLKIVDAPRFPWRGFLLDTARHFYPKSFILHVIDSLSYSKFNTLHWHIVDAQSFPYQSRVYPDLTKSTWCKNCFYSLSDVADVVAYARDRGIRVVPEFDTPGHSYSWGIGYPQLVVSCPSYSANINNIPLDPSKNTTYQFLDTLLREVVSLFPDNTFHSGGDEVVYGCWNESSDIRKFMSQRGWAGNYNKLMQYFEDNMNQILTNVNRRPVVWQEPFQNGVKLPANTIVEAWKDPSVMLDAVRAGYFGINAGGWYLDQQIPGLPTHYEWEDTWTNFYNLEIVPQGSLTPEQEARVFGGEVAMWSEQVDAVNFDGRVWPRACAVGERLWSPRSVTDLTSAKTRLIAHRCRLALRGVRAGPIAPDYCPVDTM